MRWIILVLLMLLSSSYEAIARGGHGGSVRVRGHLKNNGTFVMPHHRSLPDGNFYNNWSTNGNINPYTGQTGTRVTSPAGYGGGARYSVPIPSTYAPIYVTPPASILASDSSSNLHTLPLSQNGSGSVQTLKNPEFIHGRIVGISDGDTVTLLAKGNQQFKIRLAQIDAPESGQDLGQRSKQSLSKLIYGKAVTVEKVDEDRYGRTVRCGG